MDFAVTFDIIITYLRSEERQMGVRPRMYYNLVTFKT